MTAENPTDVQLLIDRIDQDPNHELPEGVTAIIKRAEVLGTKDRPYVNGLIYYDKEGRFEDGYPINTMVTSIEGHIYTTYSGAKYIVEVVMPERSARG